MHLNDARKSYFSNSCMSPVSFSLRGQMYADVVVNFLCSVAFIQNLFMQASIEQGDNSCNTITFVARRQH